MAVKLLKQCRSPLPCVLASASFILLWTLCSSSSPLEGDVKALLNFKASIADPHDYLADWIGEDDPCSWRGVACSSPFSSTRVVKLELPNVDLSGAPCISCLLSSLQHLQTLDLSSNAFSGNLSFEACFDIISFNLSSNKLGGAVPSNILTLCTHLEVLDLSLNGFSKPIDDALFSSCSALTVLDLSSNKLEGAIPSSIGQCFSLQRLDLSDNNINGSIPTALGNLRAIHSLNLAGNSISGEIPPDLGGACATLLELDLSANTISGTIPATLANCSLLRVLNLARNSLYGPFPESIVANLHSATKLLFELNSFTGPVPVAVTANCTNLKVLDLNSNRLSGAIPAELCLPSTITLEELRLKNNKLHGNIPTALSNCTRLKVLDLSYNLLYGEIPAELTWLPDMEILSIWYNGLSGKLPPEFGAMAKLRTLVLNNNYLSGSIPVEIANCSSLEWISLSNNALTGAIPTQIGQLGRLALLELANNSLSGELPSELGNCSYLLWLDVHNNELSGDIPSRLGRFDDGPPTTLILSGDHIAFLRHLEFTCYGLGSLVEFSGMSEAALSRTPLMQSCASVRLYDGPTLNDNPDYTTIQYVDLSRNHFTGAIPAHLGHMRALQMLDLSHNHLSGPIPTTFAHLLHLGVMDISHNALNGSLWPLTNCTFLVQLDVSYNNFSGNIPSMGQLSTAPESNFAGNPFLCGPPLLTCGISSPPVKACTSETSSCLETKAPMVTSWVNNVVLGVLISLAFLGLLLFWALIIRAKKKSKDTAAMLMLGSLHSSSCRRAGKNSSSTTTGGGSSSNWNLSGEREPLSINVATFERPLRKLTFSQLIEATNGFTSDSLIGTGGFGEVYKATLKDGSVVAIKKLVQCSYQGDREFIAEMETLGKIKHRNLVPLLGYCKVGEERLLVYEYMHGGSLDDLLHSGVNRPWEVRKQIAKGAARGLAFLHHNCIPHIIHRDMKSSNVLLDQNLEARVSDFGMARLISALDTHLSVSTLAGTPGYVPPEYYQSFRCTAKGDVYSFGVVLLELLTGKRPTDKEEFGDSNLVGWVKVEVKQGRGMDVLDLDLTSGYLREPKLANIATIEGYPVGTPVHEEMMKYLRIACECVDDLPSRRPTMLEVVARFKEIAAES